MNDAEIKYDAGPELLQVEESFGYFACQAPDQPDGKRYFFFGGTSLPSSTRPIHRP
jgi:hypothetical protein